MEGGGSEGGSAGNKIPGDDGGGFGLITGKLPWSGGGEVSALGSNLLPSLSASVRVALRLKAAGAKDFSLVSSGCLLTLCSVNCCEVGSSGLPGMLSV